jgi:tetratricopeptide (TPR) repeat protein
MMPLCTLRNTPSPSHPPVVRARHHSSACLSVLRAVGVLLFLLGTVRTPVSHAQDVEVTGQVMTRLERTAQAEDALARGDYPLALAQADALLERWPRDENGLIIRAAVLLFGPQLDVAEAGRMLRRLPRERRQRADVEALDLWKDYRHGFDFMPTVRQRLQMDRARELLAQDPMDPIANLVAGMMRVDDQRFLDRSARLNREGDTASLLRSLAYEAEAVIDDASGRIRFENRRTADPDILVTWNDAAMQEASEEAVRFLIRASASGPLQPTAVRYLTEAAIRGGRVRDAELLLAEHVGRNPESVRGHRYLGLIRYMLRKDDAAEVSFEKALSLMKPEEAVPWLDPRSVVSTREEENYRSVTRADADDFWIRQDREWSRPGNDRRLEHLGRMAYADVIWGREDRDLRGWEVEPAQVLIRYGFPQSEAQFQTETSRFHILHYGSRYWLFEDLAKTGSPIFYSPPADAFQGGRAVMANDWALIAREQFRDNPVTSELDDAGRLNMVVLPSVLEDEDGRSVVAPLCIRGAAFPVGSWVRIFERPVDGVIPAASDSVRISGVNPCAASLAVLRTGAAASQFSIEARQGSFWSVGRFDVPEAGLQEGLRMSDLLLASMVEEAELDQEPQSNILSRNGLWIYLVAEARFDHRAPMYVYVESYGLEAREGGVLTVEAILVKGNQSEVDSSFLGRVFGRRTEAAVSVQFEDRISSERMGRYMILETVDLTPGTYTLALRVTERSTGRQAVSRREITID